MNKWKKRVLITVGILLAVTVVSTPTVLLLTRMSSDTTQSKQQELRLAFVERYGTEADLLDIVEPHGLYIFVWDGVGAEGVVLRHWTLLIDGLFVELGQTGITE